MRSKNAFKNLVFYLVYEVLLFVLGIIFPRFVILTYGSEINGLTSTMTRILSLISLVQAGAVGSAVFQMYKPVAEGDYEQQSAIIFSSRKFYNRISIIYLFIAIGFGVFYGFYLRNDSLTFLQIFLSFAILAVNGTGILLFNSICDIFVSSHQKRYLLSVSSIAQLIVQYGGLSLVLVFKLPFIFIYFCTLLGGLVAVSLNSLFYFKMSKGIITKNPIDKHFKIPNRKYLMLSSIGSEAITASPTLIITTILGLTWSSVFSVYAMVFTSMKIILNSMPLSFSAIFGNLVKTSDDNKIRDVHESIELLTIILGTIISSGIGFLIIPFVELYSKGADFNYVYNILGIFVLCYTLAFSFRSSFNYVATVYGLFKHTCIITLVFAGVGIGLSILFVFLLGMPYVMIGLIFNQLGCAICILVVIKKNISWFRFKKLFIRTSIMLLITALSTVLYFVIAPSINTWAEWIFYGVVVVALSSIVLAVYCIVFDKKSLLLIVKRLIGFIKPGRKTQEKKDVGNL